MAVQQAALAQSLQRVEDTQAQILVTQCAILQHLTGTSAIPPVPTLPATPPAPVAVLDVSVVASVLGGMKLAATTTAEAQAVIDHSGAHVGVKRPPSLPQRCT